MANTANKKVRFGLSNVHYALIKDDGTYDEPKAWPGAVSLTLDPEGDSSTFYADNGPYSVFTVNNGYTGSLEMAVLEKEVAVDLLGEIEDAIGGVYDDADAQSKPFALLFEIGGNKANERYVLYNCLMNRPSKGAETTNESTDPSTETMEFSATPTPIEIGEETKNVTKYYLEDNEAGHTVFLNWYKEVKTPTAAIAA